MIITTLEATSTLSAKPLPFYIWRLVFIVWIFD